MSGRGRVAALLTAAADAFVAARTPALVAALAAESGLSPEGVALALDHALEIDADAHDVARFVSHAPARTAVSVVLSANVFSAPLRAIAWALAHAPHVLVRTSRRANVFTATLLAAASSLAEHVEHAPPTDDPTADLDALVAATPAGGALHVYGGAGAMAAARRAVAAREDVALELHGPGFGAIIAPVEALLADAAEVALDVALFDQRGCLSPRVLFAIGARDTGAREAMLSALDAALTELDARAPRGALDPNTSAELRRAIDAATFAGEARVGRGHALLAYDHVDALPLPPSARALAVVPVAHVGEALALLGPHARGLASVGAPAAIFEPIAAAFPDVRLSELGRMQRPALDGPVDRRVAG
jgi:hypothetical protein